MMTHGYQSCLDCGWKTGIYHTRTLYQHPWIVIYRPAGVAIGCWNRVEARHTLRQLESGVPPESLTAYV